MKILSTIFFACICCVVHAQQSPIPVFQSSDKPTPFYTVEGKVAFTLPVGHVPITYRLNTQFKSESLDGNLNAFASGLCVVGAGNRHYWIDASGKLVRDFGGQYAGMSPFSEGFAMVTTYNDKIRHQIFNFLDTRGTLLHPTGFKKAYPFSDGVALCKTLNDELVYIDKTGKIIIEPFKGKQVQEPTPRGVSQVVWLPSG